MKTSCLLMISFAFFLGCSHSETAVTDFTAATIPFDISDKSFETKWNVDFPAGNEWFKAEGNIGMTGNEPFVQPALFVDDKTSYLIYGDKEFMSKLNKLQGDKVPVCGKLMVNGKQKWIKVYYVKGNL